MICTTRLFKTKRKFIVFFRFRRLLDIFKSYWQTKPKRKMKRPTQVEKYEEKIKLNKKHRVNLPTSPVRYRYCAQIFMHVHMFSNTIANNTTTAITTLCSFHVIASKEWYLWHAWNEHLKFWKRVLWQHSIWCHRCRRIHFEVQLGEF